MTNTLPKNTCSGAHCKCMDLGGQCPNNHWYHCKPCNPNAYEKGAMKPYPTPQSSTEPSPQESWRERLKRFFEGHKDVHGYKKCLEVDIFFVVDDLLSHQKQQIREGLIELKKKEGRLIDGHSLAKIGENRAYNKALTDALSAIDEQV